VRSVVQRTVNSTVSVDGKEISAIGPGLTALIGVGSDDTDQDAKYLAEKMVHLRIFPDQNGKMNLSLLDIGGELMAISQFTLYGDCRKGRRPGFDQAAQPEEAKRLYEVFVDLVRAYGVAVACGQFQAHMLVSLENDGPVTMLLDSKRIF
jgi:D-tyrosyl-tRNA(Tyr) deacylase